MSNVGLRWKIHEPCYYSTFAGSRDSGISRQRSQFRPTLHLEATFNTSEIPYVVDTLKSIASFSITQPKGNAHCQKYWVICSLKDALDEVPTPKLSEGFHGFFEAALTMCYAGFVGVSLVMLNLSPSLNISR